jgi:hypothetical protein
MGQTGMAHRACLSLLLALVVSFAALFSLREADSARADWIAKNAVQPHGVDSLVLANSPPNGGDLTAVFGQWNDKDDPDDILQAESISIAFPLLTSGFGRRVGHAVVRASLVSSAFPRGPPAL